MFRVLFIISVYGTRSQDYSNLLQTTMLVIFLRMLTNAIEMVVSMQVNVDNEKS
jgi:hypothetical protein